MAPKKGIQKSTKIQTTFITPDKSCRRKMSAKMRMKIQMHMKMK